MATILEILRKFKKNEISESVAEEEISEIINQDRRNNCNHDYGGVEWYDACNGSKTCRKCGHEQWVYERD